MKVRYKYIASRAQELLSEFEIIQAPVDVCYIIDSLGIKRVEENLGDALSGAAIIDGGEKIISINSFERNENRVRFTMGHELCHILCHSDTSLNVDVKPAIFFRGGKTAREEYWKEIEANYFAACLLMPEQLVAKELSKFSCGQFITDEIIEKLAEAFKVSVSAMTIRLERLDLPLGTV